MIGKVPGKVPNDRLQKGLDRTTPLIDALFGF